MKDFTQQYLKQQEHSANYDPFLYTTHAVREEILQMQRTSISSINIANLLALFLTAPLTTITASLQLSVKPHKHIFEQPAAKTTQVARINTALTLQEKRKMQLMLRAGGQQKPYTAPVYQGYRGVIKGLTSQGWNAFYKGLFFRSIHQFAHYMAFFEMALISNNDKGQTELNSISLQLLKIYGLQCGVDVLLNMLHVAENRYILQNNIAEFRVFRNGTRVIRKMIMRKEIFTGYKYHFFNNFAEIFIRLPAYLSFAGGMAPGPLAAIYLSQLFMYPLTTAFRRLACQSSEIPGMIPVRYAGLWHALKLIRSEEGVLGLYKGFGLYHITMGVRVAALGSIKRFLDGGMARQ